MPMARELPLLTQRHETKLPPLHIFLSNLLCMLCCFTHVQPGLGTVSIEACEWLSA